MTSEKTALRLAESLEPDGRISRRGADALVLDLKDSVPADRLDAARSMVREYLGSHRERRRQQLWVRINPLSTDKAPPDLAAITALARELNAAAAKAAGRGLRFGLKGQPGITAEFELDDSGAVTRLVAQPLGIFLPKQ